MCLYLVYASVRCCVRGYDRELGTACFLFRVVVEYTLDGFSLSAPPHIRIRNPFRPENRFSGNHIVPCATCKCILRRLYIIILRINVHQKFELFGLYIICLYAGQSHDTYAHRQRNPN